MSVPMLFGALHSLSRVSKSHLWALKTLVGNWAHCPLSLETDAHVPFVNVSLDY